MLEDCGQSLAANLSKFYAAPQYVDPSHAA
jgi:hypothetical protein